MLATRMLKHPCGHVFSFLLSMLLGVESWDNFLFNILRNMLSFLPIEVKDLQKKKFFLTRVCVSVCVCLRV